MAAPDREADHPRHLTQPATGDVASRRGEGEKTMLLGAPVFPAAHVWPVRHHGGAGRRAQWVHGELAHAGIRSRPASALRRGRSPQGQDRTLALIPLARRRGARVSNPLRGCKRVFSVSPRAMCRSLEDIGQLRLARTCSTMPHFERISFSTTKPCSASLSSGSRARWSPRRRTAIGSSAS